MSHDHNILNNQTFEILHVFNEMSCFSVMEVDIKHRCYLAGAIAQCPQIMNFINYYKVMYCVLNIKNSIEEYFFMIIFVLISVYLCVLIGHLADKYFAPILKITSQKLKMNQYLTGVTLLCIGNSIPDVLSNFMPIRLHATFFTNTISNAVAILLMSGGMICYLRPFKINGHCAVRDLLFLIFSCQLLIYCLETDGKITKTESVVMIVVYFVFLAINIIDLKLMHCRIRALRIEINHLKNEPFSPVQNRLLKKRQLELYELEQDDKLIIHPDHTGSISSSNRRSVRAPPRQGHRTNQVRGMYGYSNRNRGRHEPKSIDINVTRNCLYNPRNPKNLYLWSEALESLSPVNMDEWRMKGFFGRTLDILTWPITLFCIIFIPNINVMLDKHGWSKLLNCSHIITNPFISILLVHAIIVDEHSENGVVFQLDYAVYSLCITVPVAIVAFFMSRTDQPPVWHYLLIVLTASSSIILLTISCTELEVLCCVIGSVFNLTEDFVNSTIRAFAAGLGDLIFNVDMAINGYERMAFASVLASPLFSITLGLGVPLFLNVGVQLEGSSESLVGDHGENSYLFFMITNITYLVWASTFNFYARRSAGVFAFYLYFLYILYAVLVEWNIIHPFAKDHDLDPI